MTTSWQRHGHCSRLSRTERRTPSSGRANSPRQTSRRGGGFALQVLSGDAFALARAVELARIVLEGAKGDDVRAGRVGHE
jgi:hypothetical protein